MLWDIGINLPCDTNLMILINYKCKKTSSFKQLPTHACFFHIFRYEIYIIMYIYNYRRGSRGFESRGGWGFYKQTLEPSPAKHIPVMMERPWSYITYGEDSEGHGRYVITRQGKSDPLHDFSQKIGARYVFEQKTCK